MKTVWIIAAATLGLVAPANAQERGADAEIAARVARVLNEMPVIDGHNDLPNAIRARFAGDPTAIDLRRDVTSLDDARAEGLMTDFARARGGHLGGQFWSVYIPVSVQGDEAVTRTLEQIDTVRQMVAAYPDMLEMAYTADDIRRIEGEGKIASLIGIEGGHQINDSMAVLRQMYALGARYMTLTHATNTSWADAATDMPEHEGLTDFGKDMVREMNRIGMLVDLSHVSPAAMHDTLDVVTAPVIFSHSSARGVVDHPRNVPDDVLVRLKDNGGVVMVTFVPGYVSQARAEWQAAKSAEETRYNAPPYGGLYIGQPERADAALERWLDANPEPEVPLTVVADHIDHIARVAGVDHVGIGSDFDGISSVPAGLEDVADYPALFAELARRGWSDDDLKKLAGGNVLRAMRGAEAVAAASR